MSRHQYREGSKLEAARSYYEAFRYTHTRKEIIFMFMEKLNMTHNGASSFFHKVKNPEGAKPPTTKTQRAQDIYTEGVRTGLSRAEILTTLQEQLFMTEDGASTYYYNIRKQLRGL